ncbi:MAG TPA: ABC transporter ATP-binding protein [Gemmatimonadaceae bacterium]|nr:ABC transporter ATP-binding protein [Gemmatimonadaceae bacterium]
MSEAPALVLDRVSKRFGTVQALREASLEVRRGTIVALLGENGAGKTTLLRVAFGMVKPDAGTVRMDGREFRASSPAEALRAGLGMVHQHFALVPALSAAENVALGGHGWFSVREAAARMRQIAARTNMTVPPDERVEDLPTGAQQRLEIVKALARGARTLILDEPTAVLTPQESEELLRVLRGFADDGGAVVLITHKLREALGVADVVTVMRRGRTVLSVARAEATEEMVARAMLGDVPPPAGRRELLGERVTRKVTADAPIVAAAREVVIAGLRGASAIHASTVLLRAGEIVGIAGVEGSGVHELVRALAGRAPVLSGTLQLPAHIGFVPEDRLRDGLVAEWTVTENVALRGAGAARGRLHWGAIERSAAELLERYDVRADGPQARVETLSGGNQQKLVLARELAGDPPLVVVEQPTRGLDIAASAAIHERLLAARDNGAAVVIASADLDELLMLADRLLVTFEGRVREVARDRDEAGRAMLGLDAGVDLKRTDNGTPLPP